MEVYCTRPSCPHPQNYYADLDDNTTLKTVQQKYCTTCGMPLILVGRYLPLRLLGRGGFGAAFLARDRYTPTMRQCVVKQFKPSADLNPSQLQTAQNLFEREAAVLENLGSQNNQIPNLFAFFELTVPGWQSGKPDKLFYLVQEFIDGKNLEEDLAEKGKFSEAEVLNVLRQILPVLQFVHESGSIHRDIKPSNIMHDRKGRLYLLDFGAVKQVTKATAGTSGRSTGIYSMGFAPPEQMSGGEVYPSTDLYALAVTCITLLTGKEPSELFDAYNNQWNWRPSAQVNDRFADVLDRMLVAAPNQRFQSAQEVLEALAPRPTLPPPPTRVVPPPQMVTPPTPPQAITPTPDPVSSPPVNIPQPQPSSPLTKGQSKPTFSILELLIGAAFSGFEGGVIAIALFSLLHSPVSTLVAAALILGGLIFAQSRRWVEKWDLLIIAGITLAIMLFMPALRGALPIQQVVFLAVFAGLFAIALTALFQLIYRLLSRLT